MNRGECDPAPRTIRLLRQLPRLTRGRVRPTALLIAMLMLAMSAAAAAGSTRAIGVGPASLLDPPMVGGQPVAVAVSLRIANISEIKEVEENFHLDGYLFADWRD